MNSVHFDIINMHNILNYNHEIPETGMLFSVSMS